MYALQIITLVNILSCQIIRKKEGQFKDINSWKNKCAECFYCRRQFGSHHYQCHYITTVQLPPCAKQCDVIYQLPMLFSDNSTFHTVFCAFVTWLILWLVWTFSIMLGSTALKWNCSLGERGWRMNLAVWSNHETHLVFMANVTY